jgi:hypothetical protein
MVEVDKKEIIYIERKDVVDELSHIHSEKPSVGSTSPKDPVKSGDDSRFGII